MKKVLILFVFLFLTKSIYSQCSSYDGNTMYWNKYNGIQVQYKLCPGDANNYAYFKVKMKNYGSEKKYVKVTVKYFDQDGNHRESSFSYYLDPGEVEYSAKYYRQKGSTPGYSVKVE